jgi:hypothetical protein
MQYRECTIYSGDIFLVPENIQRIDMDAPKTTHGWQVRYAGKTRFFSDGQPDRQGAEHALQRAIADLVKRIDKYNAPTTLRHHTGPHKTSALPVGISGPIARLNKRTSTIEYNYSINIPRFGERATTRKVYIGTENTITKQRERAALRRAKDIRKEAEKAYTQAATAARRADKMLLLQMQTCTETGMTVIKDNND